jgi:hypothetical protein
VVDGLTVYPQHFASPGPLAIVIGAIGLLAVLAWIISRFGPTLLRVAGFCSLWVAWAGGSQGAYAYCAIFLLLGAFAWSAGTYWYARRRGRWPSALSGQIMSRLLGGRSPLARAVASRVPIDSPRHR